MAYESQTYETILARMMARVESDYPNLDRREGSIIFNALAPAALELAVAYTELDNAMRESFIDTASREYLLIGCKQMGIDVNKFNASYGTHKGVFDVEVAIGSRWNCELYNYEVTEFLGMDGNYYTYSMLCETAGSEPNNLVGDLTPITEIPVGLNYAKVTECVIEGENERSDEEIRTAYYEYVNNVAVDGNVSQYKRWCSDYPGIGHYKIFPLWNGNNTVKVSILNASNRRASDELVAEFQEYLDPGITGMGDGIAPIGAFVTVSTATEIPISVSATVTFVDGYKDTDSITEAITKYLGEIAYQKTTVNYMTIGAKILAVDGVETVNNLLVNGGTSDIQLGKEDIPVLGIANWTVSNQ